MKKRAKIALAGVAVGTLAVTTMILNKHLEIQRENDTDTIIRETDDTTYGSLEGKLPEKETQMPAEEPMTEVTPNTEENLTEMSPEPEMKTEAYDVGQSFHASAQIRVSGGKIYFVESGSIIEHGWLLLSGF